MIAAALLVCSATVLFGSARSRYLRRICDCSMGVAGAAQVRAGVALEEAADGEAAEGGGGGSWVMRRALAEQDLEGDGNDDSDGEEDAAVGVCQGGGGGSLRVSGVPAELRCRRGHNGVSLVSGSRPHAGFGADLRDPRGSSSNCSPPLPPLPLCLVAAVLVGIYLALRLGLLLDAEQQPYG